MSVDNSKTQTKETQSSLTPQAALNLLKEGNARFLRKETLQRDPHEQIKDTSTGQYPFAAVVSCIDSRVPTEMVFDQGIGDMFNVCIAGNFVNSDILGSLEFACKLAGSKVILVLGHTSCGAVKGACDNAQMGNLTGMLENIMPAVNNTGTGEGEERNSSNISFVNRVAEENVKLTMDRIKADSPILREMEDNGDIDIVGGMYDVGSGSVTFFD